MKTKIPEGWSRIKVKWPEEVREFLKKFRGGTPSLFMLRKKQSRDTYKMLAEWPDHDREVQDIDVEDDCIFATFKMIGNDSIAVSLDINVRIP